MVVAVRQTIRGETGLHCMPSCLEVRRISRLLVSLGMEAWWINVQWRKPYDSERSDGRNEQFGIQ